MATEYMDNQKVSIIEETIRREQKQQRNFFREQEAKGNINPKAPEAPPERTSLQQEFGVPEQYTEARNDPEKLVAFQISRNLWGQTCPSLTMRNPRTTISAMKEEFVYDEEEIGYMKQCGMLDKKNNRRRDNFTHYVEASARYSLLMKKAAQ